MKNIWLSLITVLIFRANRSFLLCRRHPAAFFIWRHRKLWIWISCFCWNFEVTGFTLQVLMPKLLGFFLTPASEAVRLHLLKDCEKDRVFILHRIHTVRQRRKKQTPTSTSIYKRLQRRFAFSTIDGIFNHRHFARFLNQIRFASTYEVGLILIRQYPNPCTFFAVYTLMSQICSGPLESKKSELAHIRHLV